MSSSVELLCSTCRSASSDECTGGWVGESCASSKSDIGNWLGGFPCAGSRGCTMQIPEPQMLTNPHSTESQPTRHCPLSNRYDVPLHIPCPHSTLLPSRVACPVLCAPKSPGMSAPCSLRAQSPPGWRRHARAPPPPCSTETQPRRLACSRVPQRCQGRQPAHSGWPRPCAALPGGAAGSGWPPWRCRR
jgi:hypothetical protein